MPQLRKSLRARCFFVAEIADGHHPGKGTKIKTASKEDTVLLYGAGSGESKGVRPPPGKGQKSRPHPRRKRSCFMVPEAGVEPAPCRQDRILSYLLHREYKRTQPLMEVANGHQKRCKHYYF